MNGLTVALFVLMVFSTYGCFDKDIKKDKFFHTISRIISVCSIVAFVIHMSLMR